jgi:DNA primase
VSANDLLQNLKHRKIRDNQWVAVCPAHDDKSPSLHIAQKEDGRILIHCKAGCGANEVLGALGLDWSTLFPETDENFGAWRPRVQESKIDDFVVEIF